ncbi:hypothetical protein [Paenibacillus thalictri]|uniref:Type II secretion system protein GspF domain-containing protein n=1 Tax=Paenibacillus thalictri TaxID=2527873 RepID=A0A4Q9DUE8_9BACL|nr:hypothetical protein [Paenibacillus thalictri]TBL80607.1 hypothetical protein EYB31_05095 [Paenibacillus thalictri]
MTMYALSLLLRDFAVCAFFAAAALLVWKAVPGGKRAAVRTRLQSMSLKKWLVPERLETMFEEAGYPLKLTAFQYQLFRYGIAACWLANNTYDLLAYGSEMSLPGVLLKLMGPGLFMLLTHTKTSVVTYLVGKWKDIYDGEKNRELFMVYNMIADEMKEQSQRKLNLLSMLTKLRDYTVRIKPSINVALRKFDEGPHTAMMAMAEHIRTKEARELCKLLADLELARPGDISALVEAREESYTNLLRENRRRRRKFFGHIAYGIAFMPLLIYLWNALHIAQQYVSDLSRTTNQLG